LPQVEQIPSLTATAIRYAKKTQVPAAIIVSTDGRIDYAFLSNDMREFPGIEWLKKGDRLPAGSVSASVARQGGQRRDEAPVGLDIWLGGRRGIEAIEEVLALGDYGKVLTVLTTDYLPDEPDEDADLEDRWTPIFNRTR
jgi:hypothetical protein